jgi:hypothetical protein
MNFPMTWPWRVLYFIIAAMAVLLLAALLKFHLVLGGGPGEGFHVWQTLIGG